MKRTFDQGQFVDDLLSGVSSGFTFNPHEAFASGIAPDLTDYNQVPAASSSLVDMMPDRIAFVGDMAASTSTAARLTVGDWLSSDITGSGDKDWMRVSLEKGKTYSFSIVDKDGGGGSLQMGDILGIMDSSGRMISGTTYGKADITGETVSFTANKTGDFFLGVGGVGSSSGGYTVFASEKDASAPKLVSASPATNSVDVDAKSNLTLTFSEKVHAGTGSLTLTGSDGSTVKIAMSDTKQVSFDGAKMTVNPTADLAAGVTYKVTLDSDAVRDYSNNAYTTTGSAVDVFKTAAVVTADAPIVTTASNSGGTWNVMIYIAGDNNLESYGITDINELESVLNLPKNVTVTVLFDRAAGYSTASGNWTDTRYGVLKADGSNSTNSTFADGTTTWKSLGEADTGAGATLTNFINWSATTYAADHYMLVDWNHGGGIYGTSWDEASSNDCLGNKEFKNAVDNSKVDKFDVIAFDACLMQMAETNYELAGLANFIVGSEDYVPGNGANYAKLLNTFVNNPTASGKDVATAMVTNYMQDYKGYTGIQQSAIDTSKLGQLTTDMTSFVSRALGLEKSGADWTALSKAAAAAKEYGGGSFHYADLADFMSKYAATGSDATLKGLANTIIADVKAAVVANGSNDAGGNGLSIYLPNGTDSVLSSYNSNNFAWAATTHWDQMLPYL